MTDIIAFRNALNVNLGEMSAKEYLFVVDLDKDELWNLYLDSFPEGTNEIFRERREYDCSCCRQWIKNLGPVVSINEDYSLTSIFDVNIDDEVFSVVAEKLSRFVKSKYIMDIYLHYDDFVSIEQNNELIENGLVYTWKHLFSYLDNKFVEKNKEKIPSMLSKFRSNRSTLQNSLLKITTDSCETVLELINDNNLYRGNESKKMIEDFLNIKNESTINFEDSEKYHNFLWLKSIELGDVSRIKNFSIGTLLEDLSEGIDLASAVKSFEDKVSGTNYKRPKALITPKMAKALEKDVNELGIHDSLYRRYASVEDITINDLLFVDRSMKEEMNIFDEIVSEVSSVSTKTLDRCEEVFIDKFIKDILPNIESAELFFDNNLKSNLVSLIAPVHLESPNILKWNNNFSWSYTGNVTDSEIKNRVKNAGGNTESFLRISLSWHNYDDLDIHIQEPRDHIYYGNKKSNTTGGFLDVDMNAGGRGSRKPVENIAYTNRNKLVEGTYKVFVNNYNQREVNDQGFTVEIELDGNIRTYEHPYNVISGTGIRDIHVCEFKVDNKGNITFKDIINSNESSQEYWNITTKQFHKIKAIMRSPNFWYNGKDEIYGTGNEHLFFMLENCKNPEKIRGIYNEFLSNDLSKHKKAIEYVGNKLMVNESDKQLSGVGFSLSKKDNVYLKLSGRYNRTIKLVF